MCGERLAFWIWFSVLCLASCLMAIGLVFITINGAHARTKDDAVVVTADPVLLLTIKDVSTCTGFAANAFDRKVIVTAGHCAADAIENKAIITAKDSIGREFDTNLLYLDRVHDIAILAPAEQPPGPVAAAPLACDVPVQIGDPVSIVGYPLDYGKVTTFGVISAQPSAWPSPTSGWPEVYRVNIFAGPGNSGSPTFNKDGEVIGILVGGNPQWPGMSMVVPVSEICHPKVG